MEDLETRVNNCLSTIYEKVYKIRDLFVEQFGEENVDLQKVYTAERVIAEYKSRPLRSFNSVGSCISRIIGRPLTYIEMELTIENLQHYLNFNFCDLLVNIIAECKPAIIVKWDKVTVTNENDQSVDIYNLFAKVELFTSGTLSGSFRLMRTSFPESQWVSEYAHSHLPRLDTENPSSISWSTSCLGDGPINNTIGSLNTEYNEDLWRLFIYELASYVTVESLKGGPYIYLTDIHPARTQFEPADTSTRVHTMGNVYGRFSVDDIETIITEIFDRKLFNYTYVRHHWIIGNDTSDIYYKLSNLVIDLYNNNRIFSDKDEDEVSRCFQKVYKRGREYYRLTENSNNVDYSQYNGLLLCIFKNQPQTLHIWKDEGETEDIGIPFTFLKAVYVTFIIRQLFLFINTYYGKEKEEKAL